MNRREFVALAPAFPVGAVTATLTVKEADKSPVDLDVSVLKLQPGDTLVLTAPGYITQEAAERIKRYTEERFPGVNAIVLGDGLKVDGVLRGPA
jgi:hypothetical protein